MDELIKDMKRKGLISFASAGKAQAVFNLLDIMATTEPIETDTEWWELYLFIKDERPYPLIPTETVPMDGIGLVRRLALIRN